MRIIVDAMGGDNAAFEIIKGAVMALEKYKTEIVLCGRTEEILQCMEKIGLSEIPKGMEIAYARDVVEMEDNPSTIIKAKPESSMIVGLKMLKDGAGDA
ncbi:MAG: phosphate--acyl-ACP acyltransferase, partial [Oscillospiraceae bacterium]|nr:phosphate--acyl-ACP acyltransferase [Oscillospiraceae bacterium]